MYLLTFPNIRLPEHPFNCHIQLLDSYLYSNKIKFQKSAILIYILCYQNSILNSCLLSFTFLSIILSKDNILISRNCLTMSGHRAYFKNDNFFFATKRQNEQKEQEEIQAEKQREIQKIKHQQNYKKNLSQKQIKIYDRWQAKKEQKQQKKKQLLSLNNKKIERKNQQIFNKHYLQSNQSFEIQESIQKSTNKKQFLELDELKKIMQRKKQKKETQNKTIPNTCQTKKQQLLDNINHQIDCKEQINFLQTNNKVQKSIQKNDDNDFDQIFEALKKQQNQALKKQENQTVKQQQKQQQKSAPTITFQRSIFKPKSTLKPIFIEPVAGANDKHKKEKSKNQLQRERRNEDKRIKKQLNQLVQDIQIDQTKTNPINKKNCKQKNQDQSHDGKGQQKNDDEKQKDNKSRKKIKKVNNYQRLDLKRRYKDKFVGGLRQNQRKYQKNGVLKSKFRMAQTQLQLQNSQVYNTYIHSLSRSFHVDIIIDSDEEEVQNQEERNIEIPSPEQCTQQRLTALIQELFGFEKFRQGQFQVIKKIISHQSTIFVSQTASGKSLTYIISSLIMAKHSQGMSIVISPLIALILDQLEHLPVQLPAACISSLINYQQRDKILHLVKSNQVKLLFLTPQMLMTDIMFHIKQFPKINFVCVDEAHCLSQLSQNFRTSYLTLAEIIKNHIAYDTPDALPNILCLTATANTQTVASLSKKLSIKNIIKSSSTLNKNLYITITRQIGSESKFRALVNYLSTKEIMKCHGILIYCRSKYLIDKVFNYLSNSGINAVVFHGGLENKQKTRIISQFKDQTIKVIISTTALGMGLDFQHLDCIIHFNMPKSLESFVQEIGRAGRRQTRAYCQLFLDESDFFIERNYILADELQQQSMRTIVDNIQKSRNLKNIKKPKSQTKAAKKKQQEKQMERIIKRAALEIQKIQNQQENDEQLAEEDQQISNDALEQDSNPRLNSTWAPLYYLRVKELSEKTYLRQEALLTILMKLAEFLNQQITNNPTEQILKIHPLSHEILKLSFFKSNQKQLIDSDEFGQFYKKLVGISQGTDKLPKCKKLNGSYHIPIIQKCNQLELTPIQLLAKIYQISNHFVMKVQFVTQVYVFSINEKVQQTVNGSQHLITFKKVVERLSNRIFQKAVINKVNYIQSTTMIKLEVFYSLAFNYSQITISQLLKKKLIIDRSAEIPSDNIMNQITKYFNTDLNSFYNYIAETDNQQEREMFLPTQNVQRHQMNNVYEYTKLFFKHMFSNLRDINNREDAMKKKQSIIDEYKDGKVITRVFLGVNQEKSSRFVFGEHTYWRKFLKKKYFSLLKSVREIIEEGREDIIQS